ncbi:hypothetical protein CR205_13765 [Alteribacter lacisalsi]|uniref:Uncharacterized protein n=1 Tax=Alteribacter lacisalsi TaxID=2045244 RepID=A0A2W0H6Y7_9BACI|nr:hypothetical protein [Alteribacter lacisalsi]PYZ96751.1 hypothetical protein CR205_13765 [Alteribacter lacisalsi]
MKYTIAQFITAATLIVVLAMLDRFAGPAAIQATPGGTGAVNSPFITFAIAGIIVTCVYTVFLLEAQKKQNLFQRAFWDRMPILIIGVGILSLIGFMAAFLTGLINTWMAGGGGLFYALLVWFLFLIFLLVFSVENKKKDRQSQAAAHRSFGFTIVLFFVLFIIL